MSGWKNTFGDYANDKVVAYIVDKLEKVDVKRRKPVLKMVQQMVRDRKAIQSLPAKTVEDVRTAHRFARLVRNSAETDIHLLETAWLTQVPELKGSEVIGLASRLRNLCSRNYKEAIGASKSPICFLCKNFIAGSFELYEGKKVHDHCREEQMRADHGIY